MRTDPLAAPGIAGRLRRLRRCVLGLVMLCVFGAVNAEDLLGKFEALPKEKKLIYTNVALIGAITAWGFAFWDYGDRSPHMDNEGWFGRNTKEGGMDKLGHAYLTYVFTNGFAALYERWGYESEKAARYGALSGLGVQTFMELGDSFSRYGLSYEDLLMNVVGSGFGYVSLRYPELSRKLDFRLGFTPPFNQVDVFTDYEAQKYLLALKLDGFDAFEHSPLRYFELHLGYYARGYSDLPPALTERNVYIGIGINLSHIFRERGWNKTATVLRFLQLPYTSVQFSKDLNR